MAANRRTHVPTDDSRKLVLGLTLVGLDQDRICTVLGISKPTLHKHYRAELDIGFHTVMGKITAGVIERALLGDNACSFFLMKTKGGFTTRTELTGPDGQPLNPPPPPVITLNFVDGPGDGGG